MLMIMFHYGMISVKGGAVAGCLLQPTPLLVLDEEVCWISSLS